jgi:5-methylthioadenosine/S-adenosylhomocysteine deaminase
MGRDDTGELKAGKKADIIAVSLDKPHMFPAFDIPNILVYSAQASDVIMTMVDGNILYENGEYKTIDKEKTMAEVKESLERLY